MGLLILISVIKLRASPTAVDRTKAYSEDKGTKIMLPMFKKMEKLEWSLALLHQIKVKYRSNLKAHIMFMLHEKLVLYKSIFKKVKHISSIVVPLSLRLLIFSHYHAGPSDGHIGEYKTLFGIRMRFYWPRCIRISSSGLKYVVIV